MAVSFVGWRNRSTGRKPLQVTALSHNAASSTSHHERLRFELTTLGIDTDCIGSCIEIIMEIDEQNMRRNSLRLHNVPSKNGDLNLT